MYIVYINPFLITLNFSLTKELGGVLAIWLFEMAGGHFVMFVTDAGLDVIGKTGPRNPLPAVSPA